MRVAHNLDVPDIITRHFLGMFFAIIGGFLGYYVAPIFFIIAALSPMVILTAIWGWCPLIAKGYEMN